MDARRFFLYVLTMAGVTYLIRALPMVLFKKKLESRFMRSFLFYVPYAVLGAMTIPDIFYATGDFYSAAAGFLVALLLSYFERSLLVVAVCASLAALLVGFLPLA